VAKQKGLTLLYSRRQIHQRVQELAEEIDRDYAGRVVLTIGVLKGGVIFLADLVRAMDLDVRISFVEISSYGLQARSSGVPMIHVPDEVPISGSDILVVEDILDTGRSMSALLDYLHARSPNSVRLCTLINKNERRIVNITANYIGFDLPAGFVVGYGLDYSDRYRSLSDIFTVDSLEE
jgi:hypoxanthine phosphoribosyltransferase